MRFFVPDKVFYEKKALTYPMGERLWELFSKEGIPLEEVPGHEKVPFLEFREAKKTLVLGVKKDLTMKPCQPSAHYRLVFTTSCPGHCHYCYLATGLGGKIYLRIYTNLQDILEKADDRIQKRAPEVTSFEGSSSSDVLAVEHLTGAVKRLILFFATREYGRLRIATKFTNVESLLALPHRGRTRLRFSINTPSVIQSFEEMTPPLDERIEKAYQVAQAGYPTGFLLAPLLIYPDWEREYEDLLRDLALGWKHRGLPPPSFELIMLRLTRRSTRIISQRFPHTTLDLDLTKREHKGFGKYIYGKNESKRLESFMREKIKEYFPASSLLYYT